MKTKKMVFIALSFLLFSVGCAQDSTKTKAEKQGWKVGVAKIAITPKQPMWMAGYAARTKPAEGKLQDLWAKALFIEDSLGIQTY